MKLELEVLASVSIKRKKPWPRVVFLGEVQESLFLIDKELQRLSVLYIPSGKTKRKIPRLTPMLPNVVTLTTTHNGHFICGILNSGDLFLWHKDSDTIKYIKGLPEFRHKIASVKNDEGKADHNVHEPFLHVSGDGSKLILVLDLTKIYVWEMDPGQLFFKFRKGKLDKASHLQGSWTSVMTTLDTPLPQPSCREVSLDASFFISEGVYGLCCSLVYVYNREDSISISTLLIKWFDAHNITNWSAPVFHSEWTSIEYPLTSISPNTQPLHSRGAYVAKISHDGQLVAIAVNQACSHDNRMLFVSPWTDTVVVANMRGCGARIPVTANHRMYWVADLAWTYDDLFVACALKQGTLCVLTRLGEPALLQTFGCSIEMGPKPFMPLHPVISVRSSQLHQRPVGNTLSASLEEVRDPKRQRFSISSHSSLPIVIFSDGYMVTVMYLPGEPTCLSLMKGLSMEATHHLRKIRDSQRMQISLFDSMKRKKQNVEKKSSLKTRAYERSAHRLGLTAGNNLAKQIRFSDGIQRYQFEEVPVDVLENNYDSDLDGESSPQIADIDQGVLDFGDIANLNTTLDYRKIDWDEGLSLPELISRTQSALVLAWNLGASHTGLWTLDHETVMENVGDSLIQLFAVLLHTKAKMLKQVGVLVSTILTKSQRKPYPKKSNKKLILVLNLYKSLMHTLRLDGHSRHLMVCATRFTYSNIRMLLSCESLSLKESKSKTLHGCYMVLQFAEATLSRIYISIPSDLPWQNEPVQSIDRTDAYQPAIFVYTARGREDSRTGSAVYDSDQTEVKKQVEEMYMGEEGSTGVVSVELKGVQRLGIAWLVLYKAAVESYQSVKELKHTETGQASTELNTGKHKSEMRQIWSVIMLLQTKIHSLGLKLPLRNKFALTEAEHKLVEGDNKKGETLVVKELGAAPEPTIQGTKGCRMLLSMMYNLVGRGELRSALELVEFLIRQSDVKKAVAMSRQDRQTKASLLSLLQQVPDEKRTLPATTIQNSAVRHTVQSMARLMAAYFCNKEVFIYPAHAPKKLPPLHVTLNTDNRVLPLSREELTSTLTDQCLGEVWTTDKALEYLLLCGALPEAVWLATQLGDWKTAVMIGVAVIQHQHMCPLLYTKKNKLQLPEELHPESILKAQLGSMTGSQDPDKPVTGELLNGEEFSPDMSASAVNDFFVCASLCELNFVPCLLEALTKRLKAVSRQFSALVPDSLYLPAPPVYCPQPTPTDESRIPCSVLTEIQLRNEVSTVVQSLLLVLSTSNCCLPAARWYVHKLMEAMATGIKFKKSESENNGVDIRVLQDSFLSENSVFMNAEKDGDIHVVLESFRDMCSVVWMLHARDQLSRALRKKTYLRQKILKRSSEFTTDQWEQQCQTSLRWATHLMPFTHYLTDADLQLSSILFSLVIEMKADDQSAKILAQHFFDTESLHPEIQDKLHWLMKEWKKIILRNKPKSISLASYYEKACEKFEKVLKRKQRAFGAFDDKVFNVSDKSSTSMEIDETLYIGSRPFEIVEDFLKFMDEFYAVSFNKLVDEERESYGGSHVPLLPRYQEEVKERELYSDLHQAVTSFKKKHEYRESMSRMRQKAHSPTKYMDQKVHSPTKYMDKVSRQGSPRGSKSEHKRVKQRKRPNDPLTKRGLFRSKSFSDVRSPRLEALDFSLPEHKAASEENLVDDLPPITPRGDMLNSSRINSGTPRQKTSTPRRGKKAGENSRGSRLKRSSSAADLNRGSVESLTKSYISMEDGPDPLSSPVLEAWILESIEFEDKYNKLECLLDWLNRWVSRNHALGQHESPRKSRYSRQQSVIRIRVPPRMVLYSVWQLEHNYNQALETHRTRAQPVLTQRKGRGLGYRTGEDGKTKRFSPSRTKSEFIAKRSSPNRVETDYSQPRRSSPNRVETDYKARRSSPSRIGSDYRTERFSPSRTETDYNQPRGSSPSRAGVYSEKMESKAATSRGDPGVLSTFGNDETVEAEKEKRRKGKKTKTGKKNQRKQLSEQCEVEIIVPVLTAVPRPLPEPPMLDRLDNNVLLNNNSQRKKQLRIKDKSLDIVLNERFVYDMNLNQNNGNNDENPTEENLTMEESPRGSGREATKIGAIDSLTKAGTSGSAVKLDNTNHNNSTGRRGNESMDTVSDSTAQGVEGDIGRQVGKLVAERIHQGQLGQSTDALISNLSEMIDEELNKTMHTLARFDKKELEISSPIPQDTVDGEENMPLLSQQRHRTRPPPLSDSPNTTLPFGGGGGADGGLTDRSLLSNNSTVAEEFRSIVRTELKKLIQAQQKGIMTMLNSLDDQPENQTKSRAKTQSLPVNYDPFNPHDSKPVLKPQECVILTAQHQSVAPVLSESKKLYDEEEDQTLTPVSSLSGSEMYTDRTPLDKPLTMSQLKANDSPPLRAKHHKGAPHMNGALRELHDLSHKYHPGQVKHHPPHHPNPPHHQQHQPIQPAHVQPNYTAQLGGSAVQGPQLLGASTVQNPQLLHHDHRQPFGRLMNVLRQFNSEVSVGQGNMPPLLAIHKEETQPPQGIRFPPVPMQAWQDRTAPVQGGPSHMPLLTPGHVTSHTGPEYQKYELPEKDGHPQNGYSQNTQAAAPLLRADWGSEPFVNLRDQYGVPRLIPPQELLHFEQSKYNKTAYKKKLLQEQIDEKLREVGGQTEAVGARLLRPDVMEPFGEKDDRDLEARQRRRQIKLRKPGEKKSRKSKVEQKEPPKGEKSEREAKSSDVSDSEASEGRTEEPVTGVISERSSPPTREERETELDTERDDVQVVGELHQGYALTPGLFDEYLRPEDQLGSQANNYASMQHQAVSLVQREKKKLQAGKKNVAVATDTSMDKGTTITKDTATNPVGEALSRYYRAKTGTNTANILPPDIYMGLRFTDTHEGEASVTNAFLNVVDIGSATMLSEIAASIPEREPQEIQPRALDMQGSPVQPRPRMKTDTVAAPHEIPTRDRSASPRRPLSDSVTVDMLSQPTHPGAPADEVVAGYRKRTGAHIKKRLIDMDQQFDAIASMTQNIEDDFKHTKVLLHTIEQMGEAINPEEQGHPKSARSLSPKRSPHTPRAVQYTPQRGQVITEEGLRPSFVKKANQKDEKREASTTPISSTPRLVGEDGLTVEERIRDIRSSIQTDGLRWSGISDVDDIIGEVIAKGDLDATEFGFSHRDVEILTARTLRSARQGEGVSSQQLEEIFRKTSPRRLPKRTEAEQKKLQEFMEKKKRERMKDYREQLNDLREREANPFSSKTDKTGTNLNNKDLSEAEKLRLTNKHKREEDFSKEREREATQLMRDILEDKVPEQPVINRTVTLKKDQSLHTRELSPLGRTKTVKTASGQSPVRSGSQAVRRVGSSPDRSRVQVSQGYDRGYQTHSPKARVIESRGQTGSARGHRAPVHQPVKKSLEFSGEDQIRVFGIEPEGQGKEESEETSETEDKENQHKVYKPRPYTDIVKIQKPQVLRETRNRSHKPVPYVERLSEMSTASTWRSSQPSPADQQTIPGSKRLKGAAKAKERTAQRVVKTYQERLHEMKQNREYSTPIVQRGPSSGQPTTNPLMPVKKTVSRKSKTYTEQLQALQPPKDQYRTGVANVRRGQQPVRRSHGPVHPAKTYTQQLQELQPHRTDTSTEYYDGRIYRNVAGSQRGAGRQRPYVDPYSEAYEGDSAMSPWSVEHDVRKLLYNGEEASIHAPGSEMELSELSELSDDDLALGADYSYVNQVHVDEIMELASVGSASVMSFIDWDQVDDIIADVQ